MYVVHRNDRHDRELYHRRLFVVTISPTPNCFQDMAHSCNELLFRDVRVHQHAARECVFSRCECRRARTCRDEFIVYFAWNRSDARATLDAMRLLHVRVASCVIRSSLSANWGVLLRSMSLFAAHGPTFLTGHSNITRRQTCTTKLSASTCTKTTRGRFVLSLHSRNRYINAVIFWSPSEELGHVLKHLLRHNKRHQLFRIIAQNNTVFHTTTQPDLWSASADQGSSSSSMVKSVMGSAVALGDKSV